MTRNYSARLTGNPFLFFEMRVAVQLMVTGLSEKDIRNKIFNENLFKYKTKKSIPKRVNEVLRRLNLLSPDLQFLLANTGSDTAKLICLYAIVKSDLLFFEFMNEVVLENHLQNKPIEPEHCVQFLQEKSEQSETVLKWTDYTKKTLIEAYRTILRQSGFAMGKRTLEIIPPIFSRELADLLKQSGDDAYTKAMLGVTR